jgi:CubicO group peptidase (beta-lactamase class C family)
MQLSIQAQDSQESIPVTLSDPVEMETFLDGVMTAHMSSYHIVGAAIAVVKDSEIFFIKGYGYADLENKKPVDPANTLFRIASTGKLFTWTAVMQLVEQGKLDLDADVNIYLEKFKIPGTFPEPITLTHLMTHTPGFEDIFTGVAVRDAGGLIQLEEYVSRVPDRVFPPGAITAYSNYGTSLAGYIVEVVSGMPFEGYIEANIFKPLDMRQSTFRQPLPREFSENMSVGYSFDKGYYKAEDFELLNGIYPAGSGSATAADMAKFMIAHLERGEYRGYRILEEETIKLMHSIHFTNDAKLNGMAYGFWEYHYNNLRILEHGGDTNCFHSFLALIPEKRIGLFVVYNSLSSAESHKKSRFDLEKAFLDRYFPVSIPSKNKPGSYIKKPIYCFTGSYGVSRAGFSTYENLLYLLTSIPVDASDDGRLIIGSKQWEQVDTMVFREVGGRDTIVFRADSQDDITHMFTNRLPMLTYIKLKWYEAPGFTYTMVAICMLLFLSTLRWPLGALLGLLCKRKQEQDRLKKKDNEPKVARWLLAIMSLFYLLFLMGMVVVLYNGLELVYGNTMLLKVVLTFPLIAVVVTLGVLVYVYLAWKKKYWSVCGRVYYMVVLAASLVFILVLNYWNLLGYWF